MIVDETHFKLMDKMDAELAALDERIAQIRASQRETVLAQIKAILDSHQLTTEDLATSFKKPRKKRGPNKPKGVVLQGELL